MKFFKTYTGMATLEAAVLLTVIVSFALGGVAVTNYLGALNAVSAAVDSAVSDDGTTPFSLQTDDSGASTLILNRAALEEYLDKIITTLSQGGSVTQNDAMMRIEAQFAVVTIDPSSGALIGIDPSATETREFGGLNANSNGCPPLTTYINNAAHESNSSGRSRYAIPTGLFGGNNNGTAYFGRTVVVAARMLQDLSSMTGNALYQNLGGNPLAESCKIIELRSEVG